MKAVDYDQRLHRVYAQGRALSSEALAACMDAFARWLPQRRPLTLLDLGSGTGRFSPALAEAFGGPVYGIEPSERMREIAQRDAAHPRVQYLAGRAEGIPLPDASCDAVLLYFVWHHVTDKAQAAIELSRVVRSDGVLVVRTNFSDRMPTVWWYEHFPRAKAVDSAIYQPFDVVRSTFTHAGWCLDRLDQITEQVESRRQVFQRLKLRALSTFEHLTEDEIAEGFAAIEAALAAEADDEPIATPGDVLLFSRP